MRALVIGGGFYGAVIALYLKQVRRLTDVWLLERESDLLTRSSYNNQARIHLGYHYPRSFTTAYRSVVNAPRFLKEFNEAIFAGFASLYAVARSNSKISPRQMERFCREIGAALEPAPPDLAKLFDARLIERVYLTAEPAFNASILRKLLATRLTAAGVAVHCRAEVVDVTTTADGVDFRVADGSAAGEHRVDLVFNCTYSRLQKTLGGGQPLLGLKHELAEIVLAEPPPELADLGITVMDGPFFSFMPFPARGLHSLTHVRYTPHVGWTEDGVSDPYELLHIDDAQSRADRMMRDAARYVPAMARARFVGSLREVKTILSRSEGNDGRPIFIHRDAQHGRLFSILGGKIDNVFDILEMLDKERFPLN